VIERAKGILMERHSIDDKVAFQRMRDHARAGNRRVVDVAAAVVDGHALLPARGGKDGPAGPQD
jgi:response regulator NasT